MASVKKTISFLKALSHSIIHKHSLHSFLMTSLTKMNTGIRKTLLRFGGIVFA
jgi:hypothetical protein